MMDWFNTLQARERYLVVGAGVVMVLVLLYSFVWDPVFKKTAQLEKSVAAKQSQIQWMQNAGAEVQALKRSGGVTVNTTTSLISAVESSARKSGMRDSVTRMEPQGTGKITVELKEADFDRLMVWIGMLDKQFAAAVSQFSASPADAAGRVNARLILTREAS